MIEQNRFLAGHGVAIGSETSGWVRDVIIRNSSYEGPVEAMVRIKSMRGRGGGVERVLYEDLRGVVEQAIQINLVYKKAKLTNATATPIVRDITVRNLQIEATGQGSKGPLPIVDCDGLEESPVENLTVSNVILLGGAGKKQTCKYCEGRAVGHTTPSLCLDSV